MAHSPRIFIVEDDDEILDYLKQTFEAFDPTATVTIAKDRDKAIEILEQNIFFDLLSLDLKIPPNSGSADKQPEYGNEILRKVRVIAPGLPILILSGSTTDDLVADIVGSSDRVDIWAEGARRSTTDHVIKRRLENYGSKVGVILNAINSLQRVELNKTPHSLDVPISDDRLIRIFVKKNGGARCEVSKVSGGKSGARVYRLRIFNNSGGMTHRNGVLAKIGDHEGIREEHYNFTTYVNRLDRNITPRHLETMYFGAKDQAAVFYEFAEAYTKTFFDVVNENSLTDPMASSIKIMMNGWHESASEKNLKIQEVRRLLLNDRDAERLITQYNLDWANAFEAHSIQVKWCCAHRDLHGMNIIINPDNGHATLIDYGDIGEAPASLDPVTLEFGLFFHPERINFDDWPSSEQAKSWFDMGVYPNNCKASAAINFCREWALSCAAGKREIAACAYSYLLRQLKYEDTNKDLALDLLVGVKNLFDST